MNDEDEERQINEYLDRIGADAHETQLRKLTTEINQALQTKEDIDLVYAKVDSLKDEDISLCPSANAYREAVRILMMFKRRKETKTQEEDKVKLMKMVRDITRAVDGGARDLPTLEEFQTLFHRVSDSLSELERSSAVMAMNNLSLLLIQRRESEETKETPATESINQRIARENKEEIARQQNSSGMGMNNVVVLPGGLPHPVAPFGFGVYGGLWPYPG